MWQFLIHCTHVPVHYPLALGLSSSQGTYAGQFVMEGFLNIHWARWKRVLFTRSVAMVPCVIIAIVAVNSLDYLDEYINVEQSMLVRGGLTGWYIHIYNNYIYMYMYTTITYTLYIYIHVHVYIYMITWVHLHEYMKMYMYMYSYTTYMYNV